MKAEDPDSGLELLEAAAALLDKLRFTPDMPREVRWRTTQQLASEMGLFGRDAIHRLDRVLREHEAKSLDRLAKGLPPLALIRRAKYPDRTTALPLWGSVQHHGQPWVGNRPDRSDSPDVVPSSLLVPESAPSVFLSHTHHDADLALRLAETLTQLGVGAWRFETQIDERADIADAVREGLAGAAGMVALVTRQSIASLWVLTELHTFLKIRGAVDLVVDAEDGLLIELLQSVRFPHPDDDFDLSVHYDCGVVDQLERDYALRESATRTSRYAAQVHDFLATLPSYLGSVPPGANGRVWRSALAFPNPPARWSGVIKLGHVRDLARRLKLSANDIGGVEDASEW